jgi:hypothetical protein
MIHSSERADSKPGVELQTLTKPPRRKREDWAPRLRRGEASKYLLEVHGVSTATATLAKLAVVGGGPEYELWGRHPYYRTESLDLWAAERLSGPRRSTSDRGKAA